VVGGVGEAPETGVPTVCRQRHDAMVQHGAAAEQDVTPVKVGVAELATAVSVEMHALPADPPMPRLGVLGGRRSRSYVQRSLKCGCIGKSCQSSHLPRSAEFASGNHHQCHRRRFRHPIPPDTYDDFGSPYTTTTCRRPAIVSARYQRASLTWPRDEAAMSCHRRCCPAFVAPRPSGDCADGAGSPSRGTTTRRGLMAGGVRTVSIR